MVESMGEPVETWPMLATRAVSCMAHGDDRGAVAAAVRLDAEHPARFGDVVGVWGAAAALRFSPGRVPGGLVVLEFADEEGEPVDVGRVDAAVVWAGRVVAACVADDADTVAGLVGTVPDGARRLHLFALMRVAADAVAGRVGRARVRAA